MKRWFPVFAAALVVTACNQKEKKSSPKESQAVQRSAYAEESRAESNPATDALMEAARNRADALQGVAADQTGDAGRRFFDGQVLRDNGFAVPDGDNAVAVPASYRPSSARLPAYTRNGPRRTPDLATAAPPLPDGADYPPSEAAMAAGAGKVLAAFDTFQHKMFPDFAPILSRAGWHAVKRKGAAVAMHPTHVTVHHTEGPQTMSEAATAAAVKNIQYYHMHGRAAEGKDVWDDIGYHFLIDGSGRIAEGRPAETLGAHAGGANENNIGISMMGNFNVQKPTAAQIESLTRLVSFLAIKYGQDPSKGTFLEPHMHYNQTSCPGKNMMAILKSLHERIDKRTEELQARLHQAPSGSFVPADVTDA
jgi:N-acetylmuramoyl-L-alanine amidase